MPRSNKNQSEITGLVTAAPNLDKTRNGTPVLFLEIRSRRYGQRRGERVEYFDYLDVARYGKAAEELAERVVRGSVVEVKGRLESRRRPLTIGGEPVYVDGETKATYRAVTLVAARVNVLTAPQGTEDETAHGEEEPAAEPQADPAATDGAIALARKKGIDLATVEGSGQAVDGRARVTKADVEAAARVAAERQA